MSLRNGCTIYTTAEGRWRGFAWCQTCGREVGQRPKNITQLRDRVDAHKCEKRTPNTRSMSMGSKTRRPPFTDYQTFTGLRVDPTDIVEVTRDKSLRGKYLEPTAHAKAHIGEWFMLVNGYPDKNRAIDAARKFESGQIRRAPGPAQFKPGEDPLNDGQFAIFVRYLDVRAN